MPDGSRYHSIEVGAHTLMVSGGAEDGWSWNVVDVNLESLGSGEAAMLEDAEREAELMYDEATGRHHAWLASL